MNIFTFTNNKSKEIIAFLFLLCFVVKANAQLQFEFYKGYTIPNNANDLIVASDKEFPIKDGMCHKLCSEITLGNKGTWSRYYFRDVPQTGQWYKGFVFFKLLTPNDTYYNERLAIFDVANNKYWQFIDHINNSTYMHLTENVPDPKDNFYYFNYSKMVNNLVYTSRFYKESYTLSPLFEEDKHFLTFLETKNNNRSTVYFYKITNADFINDMIPDNGINKDANFLFLQRDYKLGNTYNTVIFPVDVPVKDYNHHYNDNLNRLIVYRLEGVDENSLHFVRDNDGILKANIPYIIKGEKDDMSSSDKLVSEYYMTESPVENFDINCIKEVLSSNGVRVIAQYKQTVIIDNDKLDPNEDVFVVSNNKLINCKNIKQAKVKRFRWYIKRPSNLRAIPMTITFDGTADVQNTFKDESIYHDQIYDINGRYIGRVGTVNNLRSGHYIINGKVHLIAE